LPPKKKGKKKKMEKQIEEKKIEEKPIEEKKEKQIEEKKIEEKKEKKIKKKNESSEFDKSFDIPKAQIVKIVKNKIGDFSVENEAKIAFSKSSSIFIMYLTAW
jgi:hypothetical protein